MGDFWGAFENWFYILYVNFGSFWHVNKTNFHMEGFALGLTRT